MSIMLRGTVRLVRSVQKIHEFNIINRTFTSSQVFNHEKESEDSKSCSRSEKQAEIVKKKTPIGKLDDQPVLHPAQEKEPLPSWPQNKNPHTGEVGGPKGPEPTRYGDWERKGRVSDF
jgi:hypothetical protein